MDSELAALLKELALALALTLTLTLTLPLPLTLTLTLTLSLALTPTLALPLLKEEFDELTSPTPNQEEFDELAERNRPADLEARLANARYLGELTKFQLLPPAAYFGCLKACVDAFSAPNALVACALLDACGRYLHRAKETQAGSAQYLPCISPVSPLALARTLTLTLTLSLSLALAPALPRRASRRCSRSSPKHICPTSPLHLP